jgi:DNA modification methylase
MELADGRVFLHAGDCLEVLASLPENSIDAVVTDPPYELGFMGKSWDASGIAFCSDTWALVWRVLKPGGHMVAFGAPKNYHRLACAIEDAGFEIRDSLMWVFGTGFPKSMDVSKAIDKAAGREGSFGEKKLNVHSRGDHKLADGWKRPWMEDASAIDKSGREYLPATDAAREWQGWGTALKPAYEPVLLCAKPLTVEQHNAIILAETNVRISQWLDLHASDAEKDLIAFQAKLSEAANSVLASAKIRSLESIGIASSAALAFTFSEQELSAAIRTKECSVLSHVRLIGKEDKTQETKTLAGVEENISTKITDIITSAITGNISESIAGSWLSILGEIWNHQNTFTTEMVIRLTIALRTLNLLLAQITLSATGNLSPDVTPIVLARKPLSEKTVAANVLRWGTGAINIDATRIGSETITQTRTQMKTWRAAEGRIDIPESADNSQTTTQGRWPANLCHDGSQQVLDLFPHTAPSSGAARVNKSSDSIGTFKTHNRVTNGVADNGGSAARFFYSTKASKADRAGSKHPTVKPVALMQWLVRMVTPPGGTVLDPFAGSGTTAQAAVNEGFQAVLIEREEEYQSDIRNRLSA